MKSNDQCYWCGAAFVSRDHVPPKNLYPKGEMLSPILVPSCSEHNESHSKNDEYMRVFLQAIGTNETATTEFMGRTLRGLNREQSAGLRARILEGSYKTMIDGEERLVLPVELERQEAYFEKVIRGLYYHHAGVPSLDRYVWSYSEQLFDESMPYADLASLLDEEMQHLHAESVTNPDVFRYQHMLIPADPDAPGGCFLVEMFFYGGVRVVGAVMPQGWQPAHTS
jgi:hypothetical protein